MKLFLPLHDWIPDSAGDGFCPRSPSAPICDQTQTERRLQHFSYPRFSPCGRQPGTGVGHLRHLEDHLPGMAHDLRPDLDQFLPQRRQRPVTHRSGQHGLPQEVAQVVRQHEQLQPHPVVHKVVTGQSGPSDGVLAFLGREAPCGTGRQFPTRRERWKKFNNKETKQRRLNSNFVSSLLCCSN